MKDHLEMTGLDADTARLCAAFSGGSIGVGKALASEGVLEARRALIEDVARLSSSDVLGVFELASRHAKSGSDNLQSSLESLKTFYRDVALTRCGADSDRVVNVDLRPLVEETSAQLTVDGAIGHIRKIDAVQSDLRAYVDAHLLLEDLFFSLASGR